MSAVTTLQAGGGGGVGKQAALEASGWCAQCNLQCVCMVPCFSVRVEVMRRVGFMR